MPRGGSGVGVPNGRGVRVGMGVDGVMVAAGVGVGCGAGVLVGVGLLPQAASNPVAAAMHSILCNQFMQRHYSIVKRERHDDMNYDYTHSLS